MAAAVRENPWLAQSLLFCLFERGLKVSLGTVGGIEAILVLTLIFLKWRTLLQPARNFRV